MKKWSRIRRWRRMAALAITDSRPWVRTRNWLERCNPRGRRDYTINPDGTITVKLLVDLTQFKENARRTTAALEVLAATLERRPYRKVTGTDGVTRVVVR